MAYDINFGLLQPVDVGAAVNAGFERGRDMRLRRQQESAFALLARDPNSTEGRALLIESGRLEDAQRFRTWGREDRQQEVWRGMMGPQPSALATPSQPVPSALPNAASAPAGASPGAIPAVGAPMAPSAPVGAPAASEPGRLNMAALRAYAAEDPDGARELLTTWNSLNDAQRAQATRQYAAAVPILSELAQRPLAERPAALASQAAYLIGEGWTQEQLQQFAADPSDENIRMLLRRGVPIAEQRQFFAPLEGGAGAVYRDPITLGVSAANPSPPRDERYYDESGNEVIRTIPGTPAIGPGANLFGTGATMQPSLEQIPTVATPQEAARLAPGTRFRDPEGNIRTVPGGPTPQASGTFP